eukprot:6432006-Prymnesium_polylepis.1
MCNKLVAYRSQIEVGIRISGGWAGAGGRSPQAGRWGSTGTAGTPQPRQVSRGMAAAAIARQAAAV